MSQKKNKQKNKNKKKKQAWCKEASKTTICHMSVNKPYNVGGKKYFHLRPCQIDFLFSVARAHTKKLGALNLYIQKLARRPFLFIIG